MYPPTTFSYTIGAGLANDEHVIYLAIKCYPVRYSPTKNIIYYSDNAEIIISYEEPTNPVSFSEEYNLVIISPSEFSNTIQPLINHKNSYGVNTFLKTTETIYSEYSGYDEIEKIKYFIKDAIETYGIQHVLLIGCVNKLPIRTTWFFEKYHDHYWNESILSDLYYADIYDDPQGEDQPWVAKVARHEPGGGKKTAADDVRNQHTGSGESTNFFLVAYQLLNWLHHICRARPSSFEFSPPFLSRPRQVLTKNFTDEKEQRPSANEYRYACL